MTEPFTSRSGHASIRVDGIALHSPYDPVKEAERFAVSSFPAEGPSLVVLLGEGLGYASAAVAGRFPAARVIPVYYSEELHRASTFHAGVSWHPGCGRDLPEWFRSVVGELDVEGLRIVEWPPSGRIFPEMSRRAQRSAQHAVQEASGSFMTTVASGRIWIRNSLFNFLSLDSIVTGDLCPPGAPVLIAAPGPSLEESMPAIRKKRKSFALWALPSGLRALEAGGIFPDLIVMTDPGHWSAAHLHFCGSRCPVAMPLSAALGIGGPSRPVFPLLQPMFFEEDIIRRSGLSAPRIPPHGTVTATAIDLALSRRARIITAGLDLCGYDLLSHARPNMFDRLLQLGSTRLEPHYSASFLRAVRAPADTFTASGKRIRIPLPLKTYAGWFSHGPSGNAGGMVRLSPSPVNLESMRGAAPDWLLDLPSLPDAAPRLREAPDYPSRPARLSILGAVLDEWSAAARKGLEEVKTRSDPAAIAADPALFRLAYYAEAQLLLEIRRKLRLGGIRAALDLAVELLENLRGFLQFLRSKTGA
jgi:hypothetical protein